MAPPQTSPWGSSAVRLALGLAVAVDLLPLASGFSFTPVALRPATGNVCITKMASGRSMSLRMSTDVAGVSEESDQEQRSLSKTRTNKRPRADNKNKKPLSEFSVGETVQGKVVSIMAYGAFVDIGTTTDGLVHVSQLADNFVSDIASVIKVGDEVSARIISIDTATNKISLSMRSENAPKREGGGGGQRQERQPRQEKSGGGRVEVPEEFRNFDAKVFLPGKVASVMDYGCFVSIAEGVDALVHVSEISEERNVDPSKMFKVGQDVKVRIISYDKSKKRLSLSMKEWTEPVVKDETDEIKSYVDPVPEGTKTAFAMAWAAAQKK